MGSEMCIRDSSSNGALKFLNLCTNAAHLLPSRLDFCDDELELVDLCHRLTGAKTRPEVQECFPKTCRTESVAIRPRSRVFHMARRSLQAASFSSMVNDCPPFQVVSQSVARHAARALVSVKLLD